MRDVKILLIVALMLLFGNGVSYAAFDNSHHDMRSYNAQTEGCLQCHGKNTTSSSTALDNQIGSVGGLCLARCHAGGQLAGAANAGLTPTAGPSVTTPIGATYATAAGTADIAITYFSASHGRTPGNLTNPGFGSNSVAAWAPAGAGTWPYVAASTNLQCTSCHAVHDNQNAPFLWAPLAPQAANTQTGATAGFCDRCHEETGRRQSIVAAPGGNHPVNIQVDNAAMAGRSSVDRHGRRIYIQTFNALNLFDVPNPAPNTLVNGFNASTMWNSGGHLVNPGTSAVQNTAAITAWNAASSSQIMGCYTCHAAHRTNQSGENALTVVVTSDNMTAGGWNTLCVGCHGTSTTAATDKEEWVVGSLTGYGHPVGQSTGPVGGVYTTSVGGITFAIATPTYVNAQPGTGNGLGSAGQVLCTSCHKVHGGDQMALANLGQTAGTPICKKCHTGIGIPNVNDISKGGAASATNSNKPNSHHVTRPSTSGINTPATATQTGETASGFSNDLYIKTPSWRVAGGLGDLSTGMDCADCHTFPSAGGTAHNW